MIPTIGEVRAYLAEFGTSEECISGSEEIGSGDKVLCGGNEGYTITRCDDVRFDIHERNGFGSGFFRLRDVQVHLVAIEIGVVAERRRLILAEHCTTA